MSSKTYKKVSVVKLSTNFSEATEVIEVPLVPPTDDNVLLKVVYVGVNATDINRTAGRYATVNVPFDTGFEAIGVIESVGPKVCDSNVKAGQYALFAAISETARAYSQYIFVKHDSIILVPELKPEFIALFISGLTAAISLDYAGRVTKDDKVLITAAAGGTGHIAVQWAKLKGAHVIGLTSNRNKANVLKKLGVDRVINYKEEDLNDVLTKEYPDGVDVIWETIGGNVFETLFKHLALKGRLVIIGGTTGYKTDGIPDIAIPNLPTQLLRNSRSLVGFALYSYRDVYNEYFEKLKQLVSSNELKIVLDFGETSPNGIFEGIDTVSRAVEYLHSGDNIGKVVVNIQI